MGTAILRRYVLIGAIGQGGVSTVYSAVDARRGRKLAVKVLAPTLADDPAARDDVRREALITDRLRHPSVPRVFEYGEAPLPDGTVVPYVVLELLAGVPLTDMLADGPLDWPEAVRIAATAADVLAVAHRRGVVHRDLTARNIMVTPAGSRSSTSAWPPPRCATATPAPARSWSEANRGCPSHPEDGVRPARRRRVHARHAALRDAHRQSRRTRPRSPPPSSPPAGSRTWRRPRCWPCPACPPGVRDLVRACMAKTPEDRPRSADVALSIWEILDREEYRLPVASLS